MKTILMSLCLLALAGCGVEGANLSEMKSVFGDDDLTPYPFDNDFSRSIGVTRSGCTVSHLGDGIVLTAGHCVPSNYCQSNAFIVTWGVTQKKPSGVLQGKCQEVIARNYSKLSDYAVLQYDSYPEGFLDFNIKRRPKFKDQLTIYSHPRGEVLQGSNWCTHLGEHQGARFKYECDTKKGSSGAPIFNKDFEVVGVHNLGKAELGFNAGTYLFDIANSD